MPKYFDTKKGSLESAVFEAVSPAQQAAIAISKKEKGEKPKDEKDENNYIHAAKLAKDKGEKTFTIGGKEYDVEEALKTETNKVTEKKANYINLKFNSPADTKKAVKWMKDNLPGNDQGFTGMSAKGNFIDFEDVDDADKLMSQLKKAGLKFKVDHRESVSETNKNDKSDDGEGLDAVQPKAVKKKFADRKDKDIDNDGDVDSSDKFLHKRRKAISKAVKSEEVNEKVEYVEYKFKNKNDAMAAKKMLDAVQLMGFDVNDDGASQGELTVDAGNKDMTKYHKEIMKKFRPKVLTQEKKEEVKEETTLAMKAAQYISSMWAEAAAEKDGVKTKSEEEEEPKKNGKTMTGKEMSKVEIAPKDKV